MAASAKYQSLGGKSVCRAALILRWTPPGVGKVVVDTYKLTGIGAGSPSAAEELLAIVALTCMERDRHYERNLGKGWREWWDEVESARKAERDAKRRTHVEKVGTVLAARLDDERHRADEKDRLKKANAAAAASAPGGAATLAGPPNGTESPDTDEQKDVQAPSTVQPYSDAEAETTRAMWQRTTSSNRFAQMLPGRQGLPIAKFKDTILETLHKNQIFVLSGETGCGKSTQVPAYIVEACMAAGQPCKVYVTEPRRISAISLAERVSQELGEAPNAVGSDDSLIGSGVRLDSKIGRNARLVYATTGIVLRMLESGRLEGVTHIVLDEVHERSIESDFLLIILKTLMQVRTDLKVILMSATLDAERISAYFGGCPTIAVPGRTFPVDVRYLEDAIELTDYTIEDGSPYARRPKRWNERKADVPGNRAKLTSTEAEEEAPDLDDDDEQDGPASTMTTEEIKKYRPKTISTLDRMDENVIQHELIITLLERICFEDDTLRPYSPAILIFMPGIADIRKLTDLLNGHRSFGSQSFRIFPLHSTISNEDQGSVFNVPPKGVRKIVIATNIAETGITIPDITCVIDSGKHREMRFDEKRQLSRLVECFVAKSNAKQRRGRAGRVQEGLCFHLFTKLRHDKYFADHPLPEMLRLSLQDLALKLKVMKVRIGTSIEDALSKAMDPPSSVNIQRAIAALVEVKALTASEEITALGRHLSRLPLDVHMGKFLLVAALVGALDPALTIAATLNSKSPFITPAKASFKAGDSDFVTYAKAFAAWRRAIDNNFARQFCTKNFLSPQNLQGIEELRLQYFGYLIDSGFVTVNAETKQDLAKARFRSGRNAKPLMIPEHLSLNANSLAVLNAALCAGLYPKLLAIDSRSYQIRTIDLPKGFNHLVYFTLMQSKKLYAWETGAVDDRGIILMCGDADFKVTSSSLFIDRQRIRFFIPDSKTLLALRLLRDQLSKLINSSYRNPGREWTQDQRNYFDLATQVLGMGANDKDKVMQT
ncbi:p-loop containing nucleoside triphosphate hydrolase protein [Ceraceosorus bombacis]|uniref:RNA helicase n=1 Tax=Ceraceosorus bombacis TaxID=401625 RepID=A0A0N7LA78_9BASI|nr:p-loop containing nucleoside triphosphate hydrolase protein [Ceraceosorus bombacis]